MKVKSLTPVIATYKLKESKEFYTRHLGFKPDIVVKVKSKDSEIMNKIITNTIRRLPGITSTTTLIAI